MQGWQYGKRLIYYVIKVHPSGTTLTHGFVAVDLLTFYTPLSTRVNTVASPVLIPTLTLLNKIPSPVFKAFKNLKH